MYTSISIIGAGVIGSAIAKILAMKKFSSKIIASRHKIYKIKELEKYGIILTNDNKWAVKNADVIVIAVKPYSIDDVLNEIKDIVAGKLIISLVAGVTINYIEKYIPQAKIVRAMPNLAVLVGESFTVYSFSNRVGDEDKEFAKTFFSLMGISYEVDEKLLNIYTSFTGSGPAYMAIFIEAMVYAGLRVGIPRDLALQGASQVAIGTGKLIRDGKIHYSKIKEMVVTPAGTTIEGIFELESTGLRRGFMRAVVAAAKKADNLSKKYS